MKTISCLLFLISSLWCHSQTIEEVKAEMDSMHILHADIVLRQVILETGWLKSQKCKENHNLFGFNNGDKYFKTWQASIAYYADWQKKYYKNLNEDYYSFLKRVHYAHDGDLYVKTLKQIKLKN